MISVSYYASGGLPSTAAGDELEVVEALTCLGSYSLPSGSSERETKRRFAIDRSYMFSLSLDKKTIWNSAVELDTKLQLYRLLVLPVLSSIIYSSETWFPTESHNKKLDTSKCNASCESSSCHTRVMWAATWSEGEQLSHGSLPVSEKADRVSSSTFF